MISRLGPFVVITPPAVIGWAVMIAEFATICIPAGIKSRIARSNAAAVELAVWPMTSWKVISSRASRVASPPTIVLAICNRGSATVTRTAGVVAGSTPSPGMSNVAALSSVVRVPTPTLPATFSTMALTRITNELLFVTLSPVVEIAPNVNVGSVPVANGPPLTTGSATVPPKSAASSPPLSATVVTRVKLLYCMPAGRLSVKVIPAGVVPSGKVTRKA